MANHLYGSNWTDERIKTLKKLWDRGYSASLIAEQLGGVTRRAVLGKVWRLKLKPRITTCARDTGPKHKAGAGVKKHSPKPLVSHECATSVAQPLPGARDTDPSICPKYIPLRDLNSKTCRWPYGDGPFSFCGCEVMEGRPYCLAHMLRAVGKGTPSERSAVRVLERAAA